MIWGVTPPGNICLQLGLHCKIELNLGSTEWTFWAESGAFSNYLPLFVVLPFVCGLFLYQQSFVFLQEYNCSLIIQVNPNLRWFSCRGLISTNNKLQTRTAKNKLRKKIFESMPQTLRQLVDPEFQLYLVVHTM